MSVLLLIEDNEDDAFLLMRALRRKLPDLKIRTATDGAQAMDCLFPTDPSGRFRPDLICLDLNLPKVSGFDVLTRIKSCPDTQRIPLMVSSTTTDPREIERCYALGADLFVPKLVGYSEFERAMEEVLQYWWQHRCLPPRAS